MAIREFLSNKFGISLIIHQEIKSSFIRS